MDVDVVGHVVGLAGRAVSQLLWCVLRPCRCLESAAHFPLPPYILLCSAAHRSLARLLVRSLSCLLFAYVVAASLLID